MDLARRQLSGAEISLVYSEDEASPDKRGTGKASADSSSPTASPLAGNLTATNVCASGRCKRGSSRHHPRLGLPLCEPHWQSFVAFCRSGWPRDEDGSQFECQLCCNETIEIGRELAGESAQVSVTLCDGCGAAWCEACLASRLGDAAVAQLLSSDAAWHCPYCDRAVLKAFAAESVERIAPPVQLSVG